MTKKEIYVEILRSLPDFIPYLLQHSNLPGPRANLELADAAAFLATPYQIAHLLSYEYQENQEQSAIEFLPVCGTIALGYELCRGKQEVKGLLLHLACDQRWRVRESVAIALQIFGDVDIEKMLEIVRELSQGTPYQQRAAAAAICEPRLLQKSIYAIAALETLDTITRSILSQTERRTDEFKALRKALAYCWSVAVAAQPVEGKSLFSEWIQTTDKDIRWILRENLKKNRLIRLDQAWVQKMNALLGETL